MRVFMIFILCILPLFSIAAEEDSGGISLAATRVIFTSDKNSAGLTVNNSSKRDVWLLRSWVTPYGKSEKKTNHTGDVMKKDVPFFITPPLYRIESEGQIQLRINGTSLSSLPTDRESVFYINVMAIPPQTSMGTGKDITSGKLSGGYIQFAINNQIKLFYRPTALNDPSKLNAARQHLVFTREGNDIDIYNPTPYYITLVNINVNGSPLPDEKKLETMVTPFSHLRLPAPDARMMEYQTINDFGGNTATEKVKF